MEDVYAPCGQHSYKTKETNMSKDKGRKEVKKPKRIKEK